MSNSAAKAFAAISSGSTASDERSSRKRTGKLRSTYRTLSNRALIAANYPTLQYRIDAAAGQVYLEGPLMLITDCGVRTLVKVQLQSPRDYPASEPRVYDLDNQFPHIADRHFFRDGQCCLWLPPEARWDEHEPAALLNFLQEVAIFFDRQLVFDAEGTGVWPGPERGHGDAGFIGFVLELVDGNH